MHVYIYIYTHMHIYTCIHMYVSIYTHVYIYIYIHTYIYIYIHTHTHMYTHIMYRYITHREYVCMYIYIYIMVREFARDGCTSPTSARLGTAESRSKEPQSQGPSRPSMHDSEQTSAADGGKSCEPASSRNMSTMGRIRILDFTRDLIK